ncbi:MAG TPA: AAA family ATPase, partial [Actinomycetota bacterium]|nr:AAA family ATPase [Actinomycetota bacterium]
MGGHGNVRVQVLGVLAVAVDGREVPAHRLASRKGRTLLKLLLARRGAVVPAEVLVEALWGARPPADPDANLATLVSRLRAVLGPDAIAGDRQGWRFVAGARVEVDLDEAEGLAGEAGARLGGEPALALAAADRALALVGRGPFLAADPLDEPAWRAVMRANAAVGEPAAALAAYERLRQTLASELGTDPSPESQTLHLAVLRGVPGTEETEAAIPAASGLVPSDPGFVGREVEFAELAAAWKEAVGGRPGMVLVLGEAGIGKTRLVEAVAELAGATGGLVVQARCYEAERSLFLQPVAEAVRAAALALPPGRVAAAAGAAAGTLAELVPDLRRLLDLPGYERAPAELQRRRSFEAV